MVWFGVLFAILIWIRLRFTWCVESCSVVWSCLCLGVFISVVVLGLYGRRFFIV